jgi:DNA-binding transcriptional LysR family regulator
MDRMASMAAFTKVVGAGSFSAAAREMQVSQALVTKQIQGLESWLGARLLNRTTRRLSLTEVGTAFYERAARILEAVEEAKNAAGALQTVPRGRLRINARSRSACSIWRRRLPISCSAFPMSPSRCW